MQSDAKTPDDYIATLPGDRISAMQQLRTVISTNLPEGFSEVMGYGMLSYVVPHSLYPPGYHCDPKTPLPFISIASQKNFIAIYHMGIYANKPLLDWFVSHYAQHCKFKLDMGKSCIRFKRVDAIPFDLIGELATKITPQQWIEMYESLLKR